MVHIYPTLPTISVSGTLALKQSSYIVPWRYSGLPNAHNLPFLDIGEVLTPVLHSLGLI